MNLKKNAYIETHENVTIEYETANLGSRFLASLLDNLIFYGVIALVILIITLALIYNPSFSTEVEDTPLTSSEYFWGLAVILIIHFILRYFYFVFFEMIMKGQSPGKKAAKIRVISTTGEPINFLSSLIRNFLRIVDSLPASYVVGSLFVIFNKRSQRLGDIVANTMVIKAKKDIMFTKQLTTLLEDEKAKEIDMQDLLDKYLGDSTNVTENKANDDANSTNIFGATISKEEYELLSEYLRQRETIPDTNIMDVKLFNYFFRRVGAQIPQQMYYSYVLQFLQGVEKYNKQFYGYYANPN